MSESKQVIVYRRDLKMRKGKIAAQVAHASMAVFFNRQARHNKLKGDYLYVPLTGDMASWVNGSFAKIVLSVEDEEALLRTYQEACDRGLPASIITDAGRTEFKGVPTRTTVAIGPAKASEIDKITGPNGIIPTKLA